jgi:hypothetical protein
MSDNLSEYTIIGAAFNDLDLFVDLFNKKDRNFYFDFDFVIRVNMDMNRCEFVKLIERLYLTDLFNSEITQDRINLNLIKIISYTATIGEYEFVKSIERLNVPDSFRQDLYDRGLSLSIIYNKLEYMKECLKLLKNVNITDYMIFDAIVSNNNEVVKYLIENGYYTKYEKVMNYASKNANHNMVIWLLKHYDISNFDNELFIGNIHKNYEEINKTAFLAHFSPGVFKYDNDFDSE